MLPLALRAVTSLSRLWRRQGKKEEAHQILAEVYNSFTEGLDNPDVQNAQTLLTLSLCSNLSATSPGRLQCDSTHACLIVWTTVAFLVVREYPVFYDRDRTLVSIERRVCRLR